MSLDLTQPAISSANWSTAHWSSELFWIRRPKNRFVFDWLLWPPRHLPADQMTSCVCWCLLKGDRRVKFGRQPQRWPSGLWVGTRGEGCRFESGQRLVYFRFSGLSRWWGWTEVGERWGVEVVAREREREKETQPTVRGSASPPRQNLWLLMIGACWGTQFVSVQYSEEQKRIFVILFFG
jgi:hypothetical protein